MYGTRDAANNWEHAYTEFMINAGFRVGTITPCMSWHAYKQLVVEVHGDDFTNIGSEGREPGLVQGKYNLYIRSQAYSNTWAIV